MMYEADRKQVIEGALAMQRDGLIKGTSGNLSVRCEHPSHMAITPSGIPYAELTTDMIPVVDLETGQVIEGTKKPSSELPMHLSVMRERKDVSCIVHTHAKFTTILSILGVQLPVCTIPLIFYAPDPAPIIPFELPGSDALGRAVVKGLGADGHAVTLEQHGLLTVGKSLSDALTCSSYIEEGAEIAYYCYAAKGEVRPISKEHVAAAIQNWMATGTL